jgi:DNA-3-methyladenine glycosylase II
MLKIELPADFNQKFLFQYLNRSKDELCFITKEESIFKLFFLNQKAILCEITFQGSLIVVNFLKGKPSIADKEEIRNFIIEWFDLKTDLHEFYLLADNEAIISPLVKQFRNLRMVRSPYLFESICWSIIGQQINLSFAYQCKRRLIEYCDRSILFKGQKFYGFPTPQQILKINDTTFLQLKFSKQKVNYLRTVSEVFVSEKLSKTELISLKLPEAEARLTAIKGIGPWSANYVLMRCLGFKEAFPITDAGLHKALRKQLNLKNKPSLDEIRILAKPWKGWEAYVTFYLWQSLI